MKVVVKSSCKFFLFYFFIILLLPFKIVVCFCTKTVDDIIAEKIRKIEARKLNFEFY